VSQLATGLFGSATRACICRVSPDGILELTETGPVGTRGEDRQRDDCHLVTPPSFVDRRDPLMV
jgi:hypothetical protein